MTPFFKVDLEILHMQYYKSRMMLKVILIANV